MKNFAVGISLGATSSIESGVAVLDIKSNTLTHVDKLFSMQDVQLFFENYKFLKDSIITVSLPWDNTMLDGKWRVLSKPYQLIHSNNLKFIDKDNWTQRFSTRGCDFLKRLVDEKYEIYRYEVYLTRQKMNLYSNFKERSSADCKFLQSILRYEYDFHNLPTNMMPVAQLEAIIGALLGKEKLNQNTQVIFNYMDLDVINLT